MPSSSARAPSASRSREALAQAGLETIVAEAQTAIGQGVSSRNSEVIHAGLYYPPGSLKARLCVRGKELLYEFCAIHGVNHRNCGKLVVANSEAEASALQGLRERAVANGVPVDWLDAKQAQALEPALQCVAALLSPSTGIVDSHGFMLALQGDLESAGGVVALGSPVESAVLGKGGGLHVVPHGRRQRDRRARSRQHAHRCTPAPWRAASTAWIQRACRASISPRAATTRWPARRLSRAWSIRRRPMPGWACTSRSTWAGRRSSARTWNGWTSRGPRTSTTRSIQRGLMAFMPRSGVTGRPLPDGALQPSYSGVRPKIHGPGETAPDFRIDGPATHGIAGPGQPVRHRIARADQFPRDCRACGGAAGGTAGVTPTCRPRRQKAVPRSTRCRLHCVYGPSSPGMSDATKGSACSWEPRLPLNDARQQETIWTCLTTSSSSALAIAEHGVALLEDRRA